MSLVPLLLFWARKIQTDVGMRTRWPLTPTARPLPRRTSVPSQRPTAQQPSFEVTDTCDGEPESDSVAVCSSPRSRPVGFSFNFLTLPSVNHVSLCGLACASVTPGRAQCPRGLHQSFPPDTFIHWIGITEEARMDGSAAPSVCLIYLASVYFLTFF